MQAELQVHADAWRATMPITYPKGYARLPESLHPRLVRELYPLSVADVYTRTYKALIHNDVPGRLKHDALVALGHSTNLHYLNLRLPNYRWTTTDLRRARVWDQVDLHRSGHVAFSTKSSAYRNLIIIAVFLSGVSRDLEVHGTELAEMLGILTENADIPRICAELVTVADPLLTKVKGLGKSIILT